MSFINIINESFDKRNKSILAGSKGKKLNEAAFTDNFNDHSDELDRFYDYMFEAAKDLGFQDFDAFDDGWTVTLTYIDTVGNKQQAEFDFDDELSFESKEDAIDCLMSLDWKVVDDEDNDLDENTQAKKLECKSQGLKEAQGDFNPATLKKYGKRPNYVTQLKTAFKRVDDTYDLSVLVDDLMYGFYEKTRKILASKGFTNFSSEPSTENMIGEDFFWAEKDGVKYEGSYDFETELEDISDFVINSNATTRKDLFNELAEWYADLVLSTLEPVEDDEDDEDDDLDENIFIKKQKRKSQKLKEDTKKLYRYIVVDHFSPEDFYLIKSNHPVDENMFDAWNFLDVTDKHGKGTVIWNDEYIDFNESGNKSIADLDDEYRKEMVRYLSDLEKNSTLDKIKDDYLSLDELQYQGYLTDFPVWIDPGDGEGVVEDYMNDKTLKNSYLATMYSDYLENSYVDNDSSSAAVYIDIDDLTQYMDYEEFFDEDDENED